MIFKKNWILYIEICFELKFPEDTTFNEKLFRSSFEAVLIGAINYDIAYYPANPLKFNVAYPLSNYARDSFV